MKVKLISLVQEYSTDTKIAFRMSIPLDDALLPFLQQNGQGKIVPSAVSIVEGCLVIDTANVPLAAFDNIPLFVSLALAAKSNDEQEQNSKRDKKLNHLSAPLGVDIEKLSEQPKPYNLISAPTIELLTSRVNASVGRGSQILGGASSSTDKDGKVTFFQAVLEQVKPSEER